MCERQLLETLCEIYLLACISRDDTYVINICNFKFKSLEKSGARDRHFIVHSTCDACESKIDSADQNCSREYQWLPRRCVSVTTMMHSSPRWRASLIAVTLLVLRGRHKYTAEEI